MKGSNFHLRGRKWYPVEVNVAHDECAYDSSKGAEITCAGNSVSVLTSMQD